MLLSKQMASLIDDRAQVKVSSVLNKDAKHFGKQFLCDGREDTCWNSDQGSPQSIVIDFNRSVVIEYVAIRFQGGFACKKGVIIGSFEKEDAFRHPIDSVDDNSLQKIDMSYLHTPVTRMKLLFESSTDDYGRIVVYNLQILGHDT